MVVMTESVFLSFQVYFCSHYFYKRSIFNPISLNAIFKNSWQFCTINYLFVTSPFKAGTGVMQGVLALEWWLWKGIGDIKFVLKFPVLS